MVTKIYRWDNDIDKWLYARGLHLKIIGKTRGIEQIFYGIDKKKRPKGWRCRGTEIQDWLDNNDYDNYVILDDDTDMLETQKNNFVHVDRYTGITENDIIKIKNILEK